MIKNIYVVKIPITENYGIDFNNNTDNNTDNNTNNNIDINTKNDNIIVQLDEMINNINYKVIHFNKKEDVANLLNITINTLNSLLSKRLKLIHTKNSFLKNIIVEKKNKYPKKDKIIEQENKIKSILVNVSKL
jgi:hypothetical protein